MMCTPVAVDVKCCYFQAIALLSQDLQAFSTSVSTQLACLQSRLHALALSGGE